MECLVVSVYFPCLVNSAPVDDYYDLLDHLFAVAGVGFLACAVILTAIVDKDLSLDDDEL